MSTFLEQFYFSLSITGPICLMIVLGILLKHKKFIDEAFINTGSKLVFNVTLPTMLFLSIVTSNHDFHAASDFIIFCIIASSLFYLFATLSVKLKFPNSDDSGVIIQGSFRANTAIIGIAYIASAYGDKGLALAALYVASTTLLYNVLSVIALTPKKDVSGANTTKVVLRSLTRNPLIISILLGLVVYALRIPIPTIAVDAGNYLAKMTLPLALICTGGSLNLLLLKKEKGPSWFASGYKLILAPLLITTAGYVYGFTGIELGILFFMNAAPVAAASYVMAHSMGANSVMAANIIAITTVFSTLTCSTGIIILSSMNLI
jgi:predicted permease